MNLFHDIGASLSFLGVAVAAVRHVLTKRSEADATVAAAEAQQTRDEEITERLRLRAGAGAHQDCIKLVERQGEKILTLSSKYGRLEQQLRHCEDRHDHQEGVIVALRSRVERLEKTTTPPEAAE